MLPVLHLVLGLGANLGDPTAAFAAALSALTAEVEVVGLSQIWRTRPLGPDQPDYHNAAVLMAWPGDPRGLLAICRRLEASAGRDRTAESRWGPRLLDLDLLIARDLVMRSPTLELPHPRFHQRAFALVPAADLVPEWVHPFVGRTVGELAEAALRTDPDAIISRAPFVTNSASSTLPAS